MVANSFQADQGQECLHCTSQKSENFQKFLSKRVDLICSVGESELGCPYCVITGFDRIFFCIEDGCGFWGCKEHSFEHYQEFHTKPKSIQEVEGENKIENGHSCFVKLKGKIRYICFLCVIYQFQFPSNIRGLQQLISKILTYEPEKPTVTKRLGVKNLGNTCYMNSALQVLVCCQPLRLYFQQHFKSGFSNSLSTGEPKKSSNTSTKRGQGSTSINNSKEKNLILQLFKEFMNDVNDDSQSTGLDLEELVLFVSTTNSLFERGRQHDSQEFLRYFLDQLHEALKIEKTVYQERLIQCQTSHKQEEDAPQTSHFERILVPLEKEKNNINVSGNAKNAEVGANNTNTSLINKAMNETVSPSSSSSSSYSSSQISKESSIETSKTQTKSSSIISDIFRGVLKSNITCTSCQKTFSSSEEFFDLAVSIPNTSELDVIEGKYIEVEKEKEREKEREKELEVEREVELRGRQLREIRERIEREKEEYMCSGDSLESDEESRSDGEEDIEREEEETRRIKKKKKREGEDNYSKSWSYLFNTLVSKATLGWYTRPVNLIDCLRLFCSEEMLDGDNLYHCENCNTHTVATKAYSLSTLPEILTIQIKRFRYDSYFQRKISTVVRFPVCGLDLSPFCDGNQNMNQETDIKFVQSPVYDLIGIINHRGILSGGHYVAYGRDDAESPNWFLYDDTFVRQVTEETVLNAQAYVLLYKKRKSPRPEQKQIEKVMMEESEERIQKFSSLDEKNQRMIKNQSIYCQSLRMFEEEPSSQTISKEWYSRWSLNVFSSGEPNYIDNILLIKQVVSEKKISSLPEKDRVVERQLEKDRENDKGLKVNQRVWDYLLKIYGGGPSLKGPVKDWKMSVKTSDISRIPVVSFSVPRSDEFLPEDQKKKIEEARIISSAIRQGFVLPTPTSNPHSLSSN